MNWFAILVDATWRVLYLHDNVRLHRNSLFLVDNVKQPLEGHQDSRLVMVQRNLSSIWFIKPDLLLFIHDEVRWLKQLHSKTLYDVTNFSSILMYKINLMRLNVWHVEHKRYKSKDIDILCEQANRLLLLLSFERRHVRLCSFFLPHPGLDKRLSWLRKLVLLALVLLSLHFLFWMLYKILWVVSFQQTWLTVE